MSADVEPTVAVSQTKTIHEYLAENPDVDVSESHAALFGILTELRERVQAEFPELVQQPACDGLDYWSTESGYEGSMATWTSERAEHVANSWIGNRKASILDMNLQVWLGPQIDVPHLVFVFGTIPQLFYYSELVPRRDLMTDLDYLNTYYAERQRRLPRAARRQALHLVGLARHLHAGLPLAARRTPTPPTAHPR